MPEYFEYGGVPTEPPRLTLDQYAQMRPFHLCDEIARAEEHVNDLNESKAKIAADKTRHPDIVNGKLAETDRMLAEARKFVKELRKQAGDELTPDQFERLLASSTERRRIFREFQAIMAQAGLADVGGQA